MTTIFTIPMPTELTVNVFYDPKIDQYCAAGWIIKHCTDLLDDFKATGYDTKIHNWLARNLQPEVGSELVERNNSSNTNEERLEAFKESVGKINRSQGRIHINLEG